MGTAVTAQFETVAKRMRKSPGEQFGSVLNRETPARVGLRRWEFRERDLNDSARRTFAHLDLIRQQCQRPGAVFLDTVELDAEAGRFPDLVAAFFAQPNWSYQTRFFVEPMESTGPGDRCVVGRITFDATVIPLTAVLALNRGFRWGPNLLVGGIQVQEAHAAEALRRNPFQPSDWEWLAASSRLGWCAARDLDVLALWGDSADPVLQRLPADLA
jgi:hypothetical protein